MFYKKNTRDKGKERKKDEKYLKLKNSKKSGQVYGEKTT